MVEQISSKRNMESHNYLNVKDKLEIVFCYFFFYCIESIEEIYLLKNRQINAHTRFDVIEILAQKITHIVNAF